MLVAFAAAITTAACGSDSTSPNSTSAASVARHMDSLLVTAATKAGSDANYGVRASLLEFFEVGPAFGAQPIALTVTTASGTQQWKGTIFSIVDTATSGTPADSLYYVTAYSDANVDNAIIAEISSTGTVVQAELLASDTLAAIGTLSSSTGTVSEGALGKTCSAITGLVDPILGELLTDFPKCTSTTFTTTFNLTFPATTGISASLLNISVTAATVNGVRLAQ